MMLSDNSSMLAVFLFALHGFSHCLGMCGGIASMTSLLPNRSASKHHFGYLLAYNFSRIASYLLVASLVFWLASTLGAAQFFFRLAIYVFAQIMLLAIALYMLGGRQWLQPLEKVGAYLWRKFIERWALKTVPYNSLLGSLAAGFLWGWIPCGLVYAVLPIVMAQTQYSDALLVMLLFGLGTLPAMLSVGLAADKLSKFKGHRFFKFSGYVFGVMVLLMAVVGFMRVPMMIEKMAMVH